MSWNISIIFIDNQLFNVIIMTEDRFRKYDELEADEKEVLDAFRQMKLMSDYNRFKLYNFKVEDLINDYKQLK